MKLNIVPARTGIQWVKLGIQTFMKQPLALAGLFFMFFMAVMLLLSIPVLGGVLAGALLPAASLGMLVASEHAAQKRFPMPSVLLSGFRAGRECTRGMLTLGAVYVGTVLVVNAVLLPLLGMPAEPPKNAEEMVAHARPLLIMFFLMIPVIIVFTLAPALVYWHGIGAGKSLFFGAVALKRNAGAFATLVVGWLIFSMLVQMVVITLFAAFGTLPTVAALFPIGLIEASMMTTSMYFAFRDSFVATPEPQDLPDSPPSGGDNP